MHIIVCVCAVESSRGLMACLSVLCTQSFNPIPIYRFSRSVSHWKLSGLIFLIENRSPRRSGSVEVVDECIGNRTTCHADCLLPLKCEVQIGFHRFFTSPLDWLDKVMGEKVASRVGCGESNQTLVWAVRNLIIRIQMLPPIHSHRHGHIFSERCGFQRNHRLVVIEKLASKIRPQIQFLRDFFGCWVTNYVFYLFYHFDGRLEPILSNTTDSQIDNG